MADWDDVREIVAALPESEERPSYGGLPSWKVRGRQFCWERPLRPKDEEELDDPPGGPVLGAAVADLGEKEALLQSDPRLFFTVSHFDGHAAILVRLEEASRERLAEIVEDAWFARAPKRLAREYSERSRPD
ncbi:MmcQ/YjbR family DNA-binding protein [Salininema proteolyticum]|uniref:MmcQ/YjbR family DNA-binding protein n=1 Tax=Salininema proteolyticum TaxID=1607685 RepID=A0ABV8U528_9ACTN